MFFLSFFVFQQLHQSCAKNNEGKHLDSRLHPAVLSKYISVLIRENINIEVSTQPLKSHLENGTEYIDRKTDVLILLSKCNLEDTFNSWRTKSLFTKQRNSMTSSNSLTCCVYGFVNTKVTYQYLSVLSLNYSYCGI